MTGHGYRFDLSNSNRCVTGSLFTHASAISQRIPRPSYANDAPPTDRGYREGRAPAGARGPRAARSTRQNHRLSRDHPAFPARMVLRLIRALPRDRLDCPCRSQEASTSHELDLSTGRSGPHDFAVRAMPFVRVSHTAACHVHRISGPALVTIAKRPSWQGRDAEECEVDLPDGARGFLATTGRSLAIKLKELRKLVGWSSGVIARSVRDEAIQTASQDRFWIASAVAFRAMADTSLHSQ
jgi:hypothetical protein